MAPLLPTALFEQLRAVPSPTELPAEEKRDFADALQQAINHLGSLHHTLTNFVPRYLLDLSPTPGEPHGELLEGSFIFADVTGFTALTGELSKRGAAGLEEMNRLMCTLFGALLEPLLDSGGDLLVFAGDAVLAYLPALPDQPEGQDARWAARTALRLVEAIAEFGHIQTPYGEFSLTMSAGIERGRALAAVIGVRKRMELIISGGPVQGATRAEGQGEPGQVIAGPGLLPLLRRENEFTLQGNLVAGIRGGELDDYEAVPPARHRRRISTIFSRRIPDLIEHLQYALTQVEALAPFIPPAVFAQIAQGEDFRQHPPVAVQFVNLLGIEELALGPAGPEFATTVLQRYFVQAQEIIADREGIISHVDPYAKGFTLLNVFGAPTHHEGVPRLAASAALEVASALERVNREFALDPPLTQRTGMTYDRIFTGEIGYRHRREYVTAGPAVNLAARLMSKSDAGQIVLDAVAWNAVQADFRAEPLPPIPLKGIPEPAPRFALLGMSQGEGLRLDESRLTDYPLVGHREELALLKDRLDSASAGRGEAVALIGEVGLGKSRLVAALADYAHRSGMTVLSGRCRPFTQTTPYSPWAELVGRWFGLDADKSDEERGQALRAQLARFDLLDSFPACADLLGLLSSKSNEEPAHKKQVSQPSGLFAKLRQQAECEPESGAGWGDLLRERTGQPSCPESAQEVDVDRSESVSIWETLHERASISQALRSLLERQALRRPTLLILEDIQWMDDDSRGILEMVSAAAPEWPLFLLVTARSETDWPGERVSLSPLCAAESRELAAYALRATRLDSELADWLLAQTGGSPLFILSYCHTLWDADAVLVDPISGAARWSGPPPKLPLSLQEALLARVHRLDQMAQEALRRGAVIGVSFSERLLKHVCEDALPTDRLNEALDQAARRGLISPPPPAQSYSFSSQALHEAIYATLSHARRRVWHERVGHYLARSAGEYEEPSRYERLEQIAYHYSRSGASQKAARFNRLAGDKARARRADETALALYAQVEEAARGLEDEEEVAAELWRAQEGTGDIRALRGESEAARSAYRAALQNGSLQPQDARRLRAKLALLAPLEGASLPI